MNIWKSIITKIRNFLNPKPICYIALILAILLISISLVSLLQGSPSASNSSLAGELCSVEIELQNEVEIDQLDALTRVTNSSISSLSFFVPLYSKLNSSDIVSNNSRENILNLITSTPGITLGSITRKLKLRNGTAMHHLRILEREGYIKSKKTGKFRRYYILGTKASGFNEIQDRIISKVQEEPGISQSEIARELSLSRQLVNYHMQDLVTSDVIYLEKLGNRSYCFIMT